MVDDESMADAEKSFRLKYVGPRFDAARLPVDVLSDLPAFRDLLAAFAKEAWLARNTDRRRVPKGFDKSLAFDLVAIEPGSTIPRVDWNRQSAQVHFDGSMDELSEIVADSFRQVVSLLDDAGRDMFPKSLSSEHVRALNKLGAGLREDERIEFPNMRGKEGGIVFLDSARRKKLITRVRETYQTRFESTGVLRGTVAPNDGSGYILVGTVEHGDLNISLELDRLINEFDGNIGADVQLDLLIELDHADRYRRMVDVHEVRLVETKVDPERERCEKRLAHLEQLRDGWDDGDAVAPAALALASARRFLRERPALCARYKIYPREEGGVLFEFEANRWDFSLGFEPFGAVEMYGIQIEGGRDEMQPMTFQNVGPEFLAEFDLRVGGGNG